MAVGIWTLSLIVGSREYPLSDGAAYVLTGLDGLGMAPVENISDRGPMQHGDSDLGYRLRPRKIALGLTARGGSAADWIAMRQALLGIFRPSGSLYSLRLVAGGVTRQIDCRFSGQMEMKVDVGSVGWQDVAVELTAPDPTLYDPNGIGYRWGVSGGATATPVPTPVPTPVGISNLAQVQTISVPGTWLTYPIITITGPWTSPVITNLSTGEKLDLTGIVVNAGDAYVIDCRYGVKSVTRTSDGANRIQDLSADSNLATFHLDVDPDVPGGNNDVSVSGTGLSGTSELSMQYYARYIGV